MITLTKTFIILICYILIYHTNPVKIRLSILFLSSMFMVVMSTYSRSILVPVIFYLLFIGGILILFIIISSITPNEKSIKLSIDYKAIIVIIRLVLASCIRLQSPRSTAVAQRKWFLTSNIRFVIALCLVIVYFVIFLKLLRDKKTSIRSEICYISRIL